MVYTARVFSAMRAVILLIITISRMKICYLVGIRGTLVLEGKVVEVSIWLLASKLFQG
jgi:hypothetical protein